MMEQRYRQFLAVHPLQSRVIDGHVWHYLGGGAGETLLLLPGGFGAADTAFQYVEAFEASYRVISLSYPTTISTLGEVVVGLAALLEREHAAPAHVVGGSYSGAVAQWFAQRYTGCVRSLVLSHTGLPNRSRARWMAGLRVAFATLPMPLLRGVLRWANVGFLPGRSSEQRFWRGYFAAMIDTLPRAAYRNRLRIMREFDCSSNLGGKQLKLPVLITGAAGDRFVSAREHVALQRLFPHAQVCTFAATGHSGTVVAPHAEIAMIRAFLSQLRQD